MPKVAISMSPAFHARLTALAERDAPGAPNLSATGLRLLVLGTEREEALRPLPEPAGEPASAQPNEPLALPKPQTRKKR